MPNGRKKGLPLDPVRTFSLFPDGEVTVVGASPMPQLLLRMRAPALSSPLPRCEHNDGSPFALAPCPSCVRVRKQRSCSRVLAAVYSVRRERRSWARVAPARLRRAGCCNDSDGPGCMRWRLDARSELECSASVTLCVVDSGLVRDCCERTSSYTIQYAERRWGDRNRVRSCAGSWTNEGVTRSSKAKRRDAKAPAEMRERVLRYLLLPGVGTPSWSAATKIPPCRAPREEPTAWPWPWGLPQSGPAHPPPLTINFTASTSPLHQRERQWEWKGSELKLKLSHDVRPFHTSTHLVDTFVLRSSALRYDGLWSCHCRSMDAAGQGRANWAG